MTSPILFKRHFQIAYVVDDMQAAADQLGSRFGITQWDILDMKEVHPVSAIRYIANAWAGEVMIELIEPDETIDSIYRGWRSDSGTRMRFHHLGFLVDTADEFTAMKDRLVAAGYPIVADGSFGDVLDFAYADTTEEFGHYYEIIRLKEEGKAFFGRIPVN